MKSATAEWVRCFYGAFNRRDWEWIGAMLGPNVEWFSAARDEQVRGVDAVVSLFRNTIEGFPEARVHVVSLHEASDFAVCECTYVKGEDKRATKGIRQATFCEVMQLRAGRCLKGSTYADSLRLLMQLAVPDAA